MWACFDRMGARHGRGRDSCRGGDGSDNRGRESARERAGEQGTVLMGAVPLRREGEGERASGAWCRQVGPACQRTRAVN